MTNASPVVVVLGSTATLVQGISGLTHETQYNNQN
jgi:hypothetical protein